MNTDDFKDKGLSGLVNYGNTCYMNSAIQCLSNIPILTHYFKNKRFINDLKQNAIERNLTVQWYKLMEGLWSNNCIISPQSFRREVKILALKQGIYLNFVGNGQNDVQEFLVFMIESMHNSLCKKVNMTISGSVENDLDKNAWEAMKNWKIFFKDNYSIFVELFYSQISSSIYSLDGKLLSTNYQPSCFYTLPISTDSKTLYDCFDKFAMREKLDGENKWLNEETNEYIEVYKKINFWSLPKILIIVLKRFNNNREKITNLIKFPFELDLCKYCVGYKKNTYKYDLISVANHDGSLNGGHYYSYIKNLNDKWYTYNDTNVSEMSKDEVVSDSAYCLFYQIK
jgi:ubiquitin C-terminal hydrolase